MSESASRRLQAKVGDDAQLFEMVAVESILGIMAFDLKSGNCVFINRSARESLEVNFEEGREAIPLVLGNLFPIDSRPELARPFSQTLLETEGYFQDVLIRKTNGLLIIANVGVKHLRGEAGLKALVMFQDITIQKKLQREIELKQDEIKSALNQVLEQNRQLMALDSAKDRFIALTTHELRTPLSAIVATAEVLELKFYESEEQKEEFIKTIHEQALHLMELVNDILDFAKIRAGKMEFYVESMDIIPVVSKLASTFDHMAANANVKIEVVKTDAAQAMSIAAFADALRLREVVSNVVNNAIKYNRAGGKVVITFQPRVDEKRARITVTDTGPGIAADKLHHVFNEFETVGHVSRHHKGTGLGMPISKRLMQAMGGDLTLDSQEGIGSSFHIDLPTEKILAEEMYRSRGDSWSDLAA